MVEPLVRVARADEWVLLAPIERASGTLFRDSAALELASGDVVPDDMARRATHEGRALVASVAEDDRERVVGFAAWHPEADSNCLEVAQISVHPDFGKRGIGTALMRAVIEVAVEHGFEAITLNTQRNVPWNEPWYRSFGFVPVEPDDWTSWMAEVVADQTRAGLNWSTRTWMRLDIELLHGGVANAGSVARAGNTVSRPTNPHSMSIHRFLQHVHDRGFTGASIPVALLDSREQVEFVAGDVALPPYPAWVQSDDALASVSRLIRQLHDSSAGFRWEELTWSDEMSEPTSHVARSDELVLGHNDVCLENVVFRDGIAVALLDFDFAAPVRRVWDLAMFARMCVPIDDQQSAASLGWTIADRPRRLRLVCDAYGLVADEREDLMACLDDSIARGGEFVLRHVEAGEQGFVDMWNNMGGMARFDRRRAWWAATRNEFLDAL